MTEWRALLTKGRKVNLSQACAGQNVGVTPGVACATRGPKHGRWEMAGEDRIPRRRLAARVTDADRTLGGASTWSDDSTRDPNTGVPVGIFEKDQPETVEVKGRPFHCVVCQHDHFYQRHAQLHGGVATFFNLEWASPTCTCVVCAHCGYVHWFLPQE